MTWRASFFVASGHSRVTLMLCTLLTLQKPHIPASFNIGNQQVCNTLTPVKVSKFSGHYLRNHSTLDIGVLGYIGIHQPEVWHIPSGTHSMCVCVCVYIYIYIYIYTHIHIHIL
jgi:hypothetical protein